MSGAVQEVVMPALGMAMEEGVLLRWLKQPGESVAAQEPLAEIETDKVTMTVDSPVAGRLGDHAFEEGAVVPVGALLVRVLAAGEDGHGVLPSEDKPAPSAPTPEAHKRRRPILPTPPRAPVTEALAATEAAALVGEGSEAAYGQVLVDVESDDTLQSIEITGLDPAVLVEWLETMVLIREFEDACEPLALAGKIPGGMHSAAGQEAVAVGAIRALAPTDIVTSSHRSHHHSFAKGLSPRSVMAELYGKATGCLGGRGGHMHLADFSIGLFGSNGIVGGGLGIATGASLAAKLDRRDQVALAFFGDGGANTGRIWENVNLAALWKLPLIIICENNLYAVETHAGRVTAAETIAKRASGFGLPALQVDGQDVAAVYGVTAEARERARRGEGPTFVEALTYRYRGHNTGDAETYRGREEVERWRRTKDPILRVARALEAVGTLEEGQLDEIVASARATVEDAVQFAEASPWPDPADAFEGVTGLALDGRRRP